MNEKIPETEIQNLALNINVGNKMWGFSHEFLTMPFTYTGAAGCFLRYSPLKHVDLSEYGCLTS